MPDEQRHIRYSGHRSSPVGRFLAAAMAVVLFAISAFLGLVFLALFLGLFAVLALVVGGRFWWFQRKIRQSLQDAGESRSREHEGSAGSTIEGEYTVMKDSQERVDRE